MRRDSKKNITKIIINMINNVIIKTEILKKKNEKEEKVNIDL